MQFGPKLNNVSNLVLLLDASDKNSYSGSGTTWTDISGNGNNGTLTNGPTFSAANMGSISLDGADDRIDCGTNSSLNISNNLTLGIWVKFNSLSSGPSLITKQWCSGNQYSYSWSVLSDGRINYNFDSDGNCGSTTGAYTSTNSVCTTGIWYYLNVVHTSTSINLYSNGVSIPGTLVGSYGTIYISNVPVRLGVYRNLSGVFANHLNGNIAQAVMYNRALTAAEILQNYNDSKVRFDTSVSPNVVSPSGLVVHLDANNTISYPGSGTTWTDLSGNNNNGTLTNGPTFDSANGGSIVFDGTNDYVTGNITNVSVYTFSIFIKITSYKVGGGLICGTGGSLGAQLGGGNTLQFENVTTGLVPTTGQWYHFAFVQSTGSSQLIYVNGTLYATKTGSSSLGSGYSLARREVYGPIYLNCQIGVAQIYNRALSATEVLQAYNAFKSRFGL